MLQTNDESNDTNLDDNVTSENNESNTEDNSSVDENNETNTEENVTNDESNDTNLDDNVTSENNESNTEDNSSVDESNDTTEDESAVDDENNDNNLTAQDLLDLNITIPDGLDINSTDVINTINLVVNMTTKDNLQNIVYSLKNLNDANSNSTSTISEKDLYYLGVLGDATMNDYEMVYINNRITENDIGSIEGDGNYTNDIAELKSLVESVDDKNILLGDNNDNSAVISSLENNLFDFLGGTNSIEINSTISDTTELSNIQNIEKIILADGVNIGDNNNRVAPKIIYNSVNGIDDLTIEIDAKDDSNTQESIYLDASWTPDSGNQDSGAGTYDIYTATVNNKVITIKIEDSINIDY